jgi:cell division septation protein DedD
MGSLVASYVAASDVGAQTPPPPKGDAVFVRAQQMVFAGQDSAGRAVVDSVLAATAEGTPRYAEALFWRAALNKTAAGAERDYRRIAVEYPLSPRAEEALFRLSQLELTRGDRAAARTHLERLQREHPTGAMSTRASVKLAQLAFDDGDTRAGCAAIAAARDGLGTTDIELRNQVGYYAPRCANLAATLARDSTAATASSGQRADSASVRSQTAAASATPPAGPREYSVQVAAYETQEAADALAKRLSSRGFAARVVGDEKPYRVRVGRYPTRERAGNAVRQMARSNVHGVIVEAEPR